MPKQEFALEQGGPNRLTLEWRGNWKDMSVILDGEQLGKIDGAKQLRDGKTFYLPDGSQLTVQLKTGLATELQVLRDGKPLPGTFADPEQRVKTAAGVLWFVAGINLVIGFLGGILGVEFVTRLGFGIGSLIFGAIFVPLAIGTARRFAPALLIAIVVFGLDTLLGLALAFSAGSTGIGGLIARVILFIPLVQAVPAIRELKAAPQTV